MEETEIMKKLYAVCAALSGLLLSGSVLAQDNVAVGEFSKGQLAGWEPKEFSGKTQYQLVKEGNNTILKATSNSAASGLGRKMKIDLTKTPVLNWSWRVDNKLENLNEQTKEGDDYAARVYVILDGGLLVWNTKALNYVWSSNQARGATWGNAFLPKNAKMTAVRGKQDKVGGWVREKRNVRADFKRIYGQDITHIDGVALMTDTDNAKGQATAAYGDIFFSAQ
uniref:DUF3047 domain-containing protein n=1 Tax=uncultured Thiotrichaceae bacterium TaxID=298394 RepID=A0A6S6UC51_9GAMM|nr:MAG: Unknown protein [uncultured Thiotrichaceae bacterium]